MFVLKAALKDIRRLKSDPLSILLWIGIPLAIGGLITVTMGGGSGPAPSGIVLVADQDQTFVSQAVGSALGNFPNNLIVVEEVEEQVGRQRIEAGDGSALLIIPKGFGDAVINETPVEISLIKNPTQTILPAIVEESLEILSDATFYMQRLFGPEIRDMLGSSDSAVPSADDVTRLSLAIHTSITSLAPYLLPPAIEVEIAKPPTAETDQPPVSLAVLFLPGIAMMALLFTAQGLAEDLWKEKQAGTLRRAVSAPAGLAAVLTGKLLAGALLLGLVAGVLLLIGSLYLELPLSNLPSAILVSAVGGAVFYLMMILIQMVASSQRAGSILTGTIVFPLLMLGGSFFPTEAMPAWMASVGRWTPNGWLLERLKRILLSQSDFVSLPFLVLMLLLVAGSLWLLSVVRLKTFARGES